MPPFPKFLWMDTRPASPPTPAMAGPPALWRLAERRSRKAGSGNIFSDVNLWQLQRLFRAAGDQDAEQRAQLVWGHGDEAELAQALVGLRARSHRRGLRANGRDVLGSHWLRAFDHLRIGESPSTGQGRDPGEETESEAVACNNPEPHNHTSATGKCPGATALLTDDHSSADVSERPVRTGRGPRRGGRHNPDRYLHRIIH